MPRFKNMKLEDFNTLMAQEYEQDRKKMSTKLGRILKDKKALDQKRENFKHCMQEYVQSNKDMLKAQEEE